MRPSSGSLAPDLLRSSKSCAVHHVTALGHHLTWIMHAHTNEAGS
jgi:hypothetical protein